MVGTIVRTRGIKTRDDGQEGEMRREPDEMELHDIRDAVMATDLATGETAVGDGTRRVTLADVVKWARARGIPFESVEFEIRQVDIDDDNEAGTITYFPMPFAVSQLASSPETSTEWTTVTVEFEIDGHVSDPKTYVRVVDVVNQLHDVFEDVPEPTLNGVRAVAIAPTRSGETPEDLYYDRVVEDRSL